MMSSVSKKQIEQAKKLDLLTYLQRYDSDELVRNGTNEYTTKSHGSLIISNGKWIWNKHRMGGRSALDYLVKVRGVGFVEAVEHLCRDSPVLLPAGTAHEARKAPAEKEKRLVLPEKHPRHTKAFAYLKWRGIDETIIKACIQNGTLYENRKVHKGKVYYNCVFVGYDKENAPRYAMLRGAFSAFRGEVDGSDKAFAFKYMPSENGGNFGTVCVCESAIDALSLATYQKQHASAAWQEVGYLSLGGTAPGALYQYLTDNPQINHVCLALDNDEAWSA